MTSPTPSSKPDSQLAQTNLYYNQSGCGVKTSQAQTFAKLGFVSPAYESGRPGSKGIIGGVGYLSPTYTTLLPATGPRARDPELMAAYHHVRGPMRQGAATASSGRASSSAPSTRRGGSALTQEDLDYLKENEARNQAAFEAWSRARNSEDSMKKSAMLRCGSDLERFFRMKGTPIALYIPHIFRHITSKFWLSFPLISQPSPRRKQQADMKRFFKREGELKEEIASRVQEWSIRKDIKEEMETIKHIQIRQKRSAQAINSRIK